jgi:glycerol-3-phosphate dehydrogenase
VNDRPATQHAQWEALVGHAEPFDLLIIGGGASGAGAALDAVARGLKVALIESDDLSSATSSRSTKLIHGGVRYLEKAVKEFDRSQFHLVRDALRERAVLIRIAPHLAHPLPLVTPLYQWWQVPYFMTGLKLYDALAGRANLAPSRFIDAKEALHRFPMLREEGLRGGVVYYDGQFDDARMNVAIAQTAAERGAIIVTHAAVIGLLHVDGKVRGARVRQHADGAELEVAARAVLNATGPFADRIRRLDNPEATPMLSASSGVHIVLDARFAPPGTGLLIPETEDGRVLFLLPWQNHTLVGTTDQAAGIEPHPRATEEEIEYILRHVRKYFSVPVARSDVRAAWSGLRPLVSDPKASDTARLSRDHVVHVAPSGLVTIAGGKWTTYRRMAIDAVDAAAAVAGIDVPPSESENILLAGAQGWEASGTGIWQERGLDLDVARHLHTAYGTRAEQVVAIAEAHDGGGRLAPGHPYLEAEVRYAVRHEFAASAVDVLARRIRLAMLDAPATRLAAPRVAAIIGEELGWDSARVAVEVAAVDAWVN